MRALGPGSVSSFLKAGLDVVYYALFVTAALVAIAALAALLAQPFIAAHGQPLGPFTDLFRAGWALAAVLALAELYVAALIVAVGRTRRVFATMIAGDPFHPDNIGRLQQIGFALAAMEAVSWVARMAADALLPQIKDVRGGAVNITGWFAILVVFVLAEVFREGARLRADAELTI